MHPNLSQLPPWVILHLPHVSTLVPDNVRDQFVIDDAELAAELELLTDHHATTLFCAPHTAAPEVRAKVSRVVVDVERFADDEREPAAAYGFGAIYARTTSGAPLRRALSRRERAALMRRYAAHHARLATTVDDVLAKHERCLVLDCHTFPDRSLPFELACPQGRPDICIGTDPAHTPPELTRAFVTAFEAEGWTVSLNRPFAGALVPASVYASDLRVLAIMVDVNRRICRDASGIVDGPEHSVATRVRTCCARAIAEFAAAVPPARASTGATAATVDMTSDPILARQAALPPVIRLFRYQPARRVFDITAFDPARVGAAADLPPYLVLGALDEDSFQLGREGWSACYRGAHPETELRIRYALPEGLYQLHQSWRGIAGGSAGADGRQPLGRVLAQFLYPRFPTGWDEAAAATLRREVHVHYVAQQEATTSFCGFPDGAMRTVAFPVAVGDLRSVRARIAAVAAHRPGYPIAAEARLVSQTVYIDERAFPMGDDGTKVILESSEKQTGMPTLGPLALTLAPNDLSVRAFPRCVYVVFVTVPFSGIVEFLTDLADSPGLLRCAADPSPGSQWTPLVLPAGFDRLAQDLDVWLPDQPIGCTWRFSDPFDRTSERVVDAEEWAEPRIEANLLAQERAQLLQPVVPEEPELVSIDDLDTNRAQTRLVQELPELLENEAFQRAFEKALDERGAAIVRAIDEGQALPAEVWEELQDVTWDVFDSVAETALTLDWYSGGSRLERVQGVYMFQSSDWEAEGPFHSLDEALGSCESFSLPTADSGLRSDVLSEHELHALGRGLVEEDGDSVFLNGEEFVLREGDLRRVKSPEAG